MVDEPMERFRGLMQYWAENWAREKGLGSPRLPSDFHPDEAEGFLRALDSGFVVVSDIGHCTLPGVFRFGTKPTEPYLFGRTKAELVWREYVTQVGAAARLELDLGWPRNQIGVDPKGWEFDLAGFEGPTSNRMLLAGETKKSAKELEKLLQEIYQAAEAKIVDGSGTSRGTTDGAKKYAGLLSERPMFFWLVAPGLSASFRVHYHGNRASLEELDVLPTYRDIAATPSHDTRVSGTFGKDTIVAEFQFDYSQTGPNRFAVEGVSLDVSIAERDVRAYELAREYLLNLAPGIITNEGLDRYERLSTTRSRPDSIPGIYHRLLDSIQNAGMRPAVIGGSIGGTEQLKRVLCDFEPTLILNRYTTWQSAMDEIQVVLQPRGQIRLGNRSIWPMFCRAILSSAAFLSQFPSADDFYKWIDFFDSDERARAALPLLLDAEIEGLGFALACDFLKELGYTSFSKPDVHLRDIFTGIGLCPEGVSDLGLFKAIGRVARHAGTTPYGADKVFWLVGSGYFYDDPDIGNKGRVHTSKKDFIAKASTVLGSAVA